jgi:periplasmic divalent cation tolerance protein
MTAAGRAGLIWCPFADEASARATAAALLEARLVACANIVPQVRSLFAWEGERGEAEECGVLFKTTAAGLEPAMLRLEALHPYDCPAIMGWTVHANEGTLAWLEAETREL